MYNKENEIPLLKRHNGVLKFAIHKLLGEASLFKGS